MNDYKIKVNNESESREAQELFFELGFTDGQFGYDVFPQFIANFNTDECGSFKVSMLNGLGEHEEITLPQLRALVSEQKMASHNIEQQELKANPKLFLDPTQNYAEIEWDGTFFKPDYLIEVPNGAVEARINGSGGINFINANEDYMNDATGGEWVGTHRGKHDIAGHTIVWQRTQDEPFLTPESVVEREVNHKNVVQKANEFSERLKKLEYQVGTMDSSASGGIKSQDEAQQLLEKYSHYYKDVRNLSVIDVYDVLSLFNVTDQAVGHTLKKLLVTGKRGAGKDYLQDLIEARDTLNRAIEICERKN